MAPGAGYLVGTFFGGRYADYTVKKWIAKRGRRIPEDRLRSAFIALGVVIPATTIIYGWAIDKAKGGIPLPVICMFLQGVAQMVCFPCLNSYCLDVFRERAAEVMGKHTELSPIDLMTHNLTVNFQLATTSSGTLLQPSVRQ